MKIRTARFRFLTDKECEVIHRFFHAKIVRNNLVAECNTIDPMAFSGVWNIYTHIIEFLLDFYGIETFRFHSTTIDKLN